MILSLLSYFFSFQLSFFYYLHIIVLFAGSILSYYGLLSISKRGRPVYVKWLMLVIFARMVVYFGYIFAILLWQRQHAIWNASSFIALYAAYTTMDIYFLYRRTKMAK